MLHVLEPKLSGANFSSLEFSCFLSLVFLNIYFRLFVCGVCASVGAYTHENWCSRKLESPLKLKLQSVVTPHMGDWNWARVLWKKQHNTLNHWAVSQALSVFVLFETGLCGTLHSPGWPGTQQFFCLSVFCELPSQPFWFLKRHLSPASLTGLASLWLPCEPLECSDLLTY